MRVSGVRMDCRIKSANDEMRKRSRDISCPSSAHDHAQNKSKVVRDGSVTISKRWARYHHAGNKADERVPAWRKACSAAISDD
jgi:hypothetical protein